MRLSDEISDFFKTAVKQLMPEAQLYLFGSRVSDNEKGGDIDLMVPGNRKLDWEERIQSDGNFTAGLANRKLICSISGLMKSAILKTSLFYPGSYCR